MTATKLVVAAIATIYVVQIGLYSAGLVELAASVTASAVLVGWLALWARRRRVTWAQLGLRRPRAVFVVAAGLVGISAWFVNLWVVVQIEPPGDAAELQRVIEQTPLALTLFALAVVPAVAEEIVFRGVFTRALATRLSAVHAVGISAAVFALYHLVPAQMITTFGLGLVLGFLTLRAGSCVPAMFAHGLNNTIAVLVSRDSVPGVRTWMDAHTTAMLVGTSALLVAGIALAGREAV